MSPSEWKGTRWLKTAKIISESEGGDWMRSSISETVDVVDGHWLELPSWGN